MCDYEIESKFFIIKITGGSIIITEKETNRIIKKFSGFTYLYTGDIHPNETQFFALENGKHFYVYSLETFELIKRITLPRTYKSRDVIGFYSSNGSLINIPAQRYISEDKEKWIGHHEYVLFTYETQNYTLVSKTELKDLKKFRWPETHWDKLLDILAKLR